MLEAHDWLKAVAELCVLCDDTQYTLKIRAYLSFVECIYVSDVSEHSIHSIGTSCYASPIP